MACLDGANLGKQMRLALALRRAKVRSTSLQSSVKRATVREARDSASVLAGISPLDDISRALTTPQELLSCGRLAPRAIEALVVE